MSRFYYFYRAFRYYVQAARLDGRIIKIKIVNL
jgi:hypothetical protein